LTSSLSLTPGDLLQIVAVEGLEFKRQFVLLIAARQDLHRSARLLAEFLLSHAHRDYEDDRNPPLSSDDAAKESNLPSRG
jgi:hypothetical protein